MCNSSFASWRHMVASSPMRPVVPITFMYHTYTELMISIQEQESGFYYDFANKVFKKVPQVPRAGLTHLEGFGAEYHVYGATLGRSANLHGQYVITVRDMELGGSIVALLSLVVDGGQRTDKQPSALADYEAEKGLPPIDINFSTPERAGRAVELD